MKKYTNILSSPLSLFVPGYVFDNNFLELTVKIFILEFCQMFMPTSKICRYLFKNICLNHVVPNIDDLSNDNYIVSDTNRLLDNKKICSCKNTDKNFNIECVLFMIYYSVIINSLTNLQKINLFNGCSLGTYMKQITETASFYGKIDILKYVYVKYEPYSTTLLHQNIVEAFYNNHMSVVDYIFQNYFDLIEFYYLVEYGLLFSLPLLKYMVNNNFLDTNVMFSKIKFYADNFDTIIPLFDDIQLSTIKFYIDNFRQTEKYVEYAENILRNEMIRHKASNVDYILTRCPILIERNKYWIRSSWWRLSMLDVFKKHKMISSNDYILSSIHYFIIVVINIICKLLLIII